MSIPSIPYLDMLAPEVWLECWNICSTHQLRQLSLVCRLFRALCLPLLFRHQSLHVGQVWSPVKKDDRLDYMKRMAVRLERLPEGPHALWVHSWRFSTEAEPSPHLWPLPDIRNSKDFVLLEKLYEQIIATFANTLGLYHNLRSLHLQGVTVDTHTRNTLLSLSNLESLTLACEIAARNGDLMKLKSFMISATAGASEAEPVTTEPLQIVSAEHLQSLNINHRGEMVSLLTGFQPRKFPQLVSFSLGFLYGQERNINVFFEFLQQCPQLESLAIHYTYTLPENPLPSCLSPNTIPRLSNLTVPLWAIDLFIPNRPVSTVSVKRSYPYDHVLISLEEAGEYLEAVFTDLSNASVPLQSLSIPPISLTPECFAAIASACPYLTMLAIDVTEMRLWPHHQDGIGHPEMVISDAEEMPHTSSTDSSSSAAQYEILNTILKWIHEGSILLPPDLEVLRINMDSDSDGELLKIWISGGEEAQACASLIGLCPRLHTVQIGPPGNQWKRIGAGWKKVRAY